MTTEYPQAGQPVVTALLAVDEQLPACLASLPLRVARHPAELRAAITDSEVLVVWDFRTTLVRDAWPHARRLRWVHAASTGVDPLLFPELVASDVTVTNARGVFDRAIAEYVLGLMLLFAKDLHTTLELQRRRTWRHRETGMLAGRTLLVVGAGGIGRQVARLAAGIGMQVSALARTARPGDDDFRHVHGHGDLHAALGEADVVVVAVPLTADTRGLFDAAAFAAMRPGAWLINVARGAVVDEEALLDALRRGRLAGAGLDVFRDEPLVADHPFWEMPNVVVSPHMSGDFVGWRETLAEGFVGNLRRWREGLPLHNIVDKQVI